MEEKIFYQDRGITVTNSRYVTNEKTYAIRNISSVSKAIINPNRTLPIILVCLGAFMCYFDRSSDNTFLILGIIALALGVILLFTQKNSFVVAISSNAGESKSIISKEEDFVDTIVIALNDAITYTVYNVPKSNQSINSFVNQTTEIENEKVEESTTDSINIVKQNTSLTSTHDSKIAELKELKVLLDSGILTQTEFEKLKSKIL